MTHTTHKIYITPLPVRIWHWLNACGFVLMIFSGIQIRYVGQLDVVSFKTAVVSHNWIGFALMANYLFWLCYHLFTPHIRNYQPDPDKERFMTAAIKQAQFYGYGIFRGDPNPHTITVEKKFNALQAQMYQIIMLMMVPIQFISGLLLWDVTRFATIVHGLGGVRVVDTIHVLVFIFFSGFIVAHVYLAFLGHTPLAHLKAMITGYEDADEAH